VLFDNGAGMNKGAWQQQFSSTGTQIVGARRTGLPD